MFVFNIHWLELIARLSRRYNPDARIIVGGGYPTIFPEKCLEDPNVDSIVIGEGEATLVHLLNRFNDFRDSEFEGKFPFDGYGTKTKDGKIEIVPKRNFLDMSDIPDPDWHYLNVEKYFESSGDRTLPIEAVRGCPYHCNFCNTHLSWGHKQRYKEVDRVIDELLKYERKYQIKPHFIDDNRSVNRKWIIEFLNKVISKGLTLEQMPASFPCPSSRRRAHERF